MAVKKTKKEKIEELLDDYIDVPTSSYFHNYKLDLGGTECYDKLVQELEKLIIRNGGKKENSKES